MSVPTSPTDEELMSDSGSVTQEIFLDDGRPCKETTTVSTSERQNSSGSCTETRTTTNRKLVCPDRVNPNLTYYQEESSSDAIMCSPAGCGKGVTLSGKDSNGNEVALHGSLRSSHKTTESSKDHNNNASSRTSQISQIRDDFNGDGLDNDPVVTASDPKAPQSCF